MWKFETCRDYSEGSKGPHILHFPLIAFEIALYRLTLKRKAMAKIHNEIYAVMAQMP